MTAKISPLSLVDPQAVIEDGVEIGPFCVVGPHVHIGTGTVLRNNVTIVGHTTVGCDNLFFPNCVIGEEPQDVSYNGAPTRTIIGDRNRFREGVTIHRAAEKEDRLTSVGNDCYFMANAHVAHNCKIQNHVIIANGTLLGGHVHVHDRATISGNCVVHHFCTIGTLAFMGGAARATQDIPPYMMAVGCDEFHIHSVNIVGLQRRGVSPSTVKLIRRVHRLLFREFKGGDKARGILLEECSGELPWEVENVFNFVAEQNLGKSGRGRERNRETEQKKAA